MAFYGDSAANPPQVNYYTLITGDHAASAAAAATGHQVLADLLAAEMAAMGANTSMTAAVGWQGAGGTAMTLHAAQYMSILGVAVAWLQAASVAAGEIVSAYHTAETSMVPGPVDDTNRTEQATAVATNWFGQNFPIIAALDAQYQADWVRNAAAMAAYQAAVSAALAVLATPPPFAPTAANPAAALAGVAQAGAQAGAQGALQASSQAMNQTANTATNSASQAAAAPAEAMGAMGAPMAMIGQLSQVGQIAGQLPQMLGQAPQMLGSVMQMPMGMLGPLMQSAGGLGGSGEAAQAGGAGAPLAPGVAALGAAQAGGGGGGAGVGGAGSGAVNSSFTRPVSSFTAPNAPKLPGAWSAVPEPVPGGASPMGAGGSGLYGAPMSAMRGADGAGGAAEARPNRTMQITARPAGDRG